VGRKHATSRIAEETPRQARSWAVEKGTSPSKFLSDHIESLVEQGQRYEVARRAAIVRIRSGIDLGLNDGVGWSREDLHAR